MHDDQNDADTQFIEFCYYEITTSSGTIYMGYRPTDLEDLIWFGVVHHETDGARTTWNVADHPSLRKTPLAVKHIGGSMQQAAELVIAHVYGDRRAPHLITVSKVAQSQIPPQTQASAERIANEWAWFQEWTS